MYTIQWYDTLEDRWVSYAYNDVQILADVVRFIVRAGVLPLVKRCGAVVVAVNNEYTRWQTPPSA